LNHELKFESNEEGKKIWWRRVLINMLVCTGDFEVSAPTSSSLHLKTNSILDLYFELFIKEVEYLLYKGLTKQYKKESSNVKALKGNLDFARNIQHNYIHQERFFTKHSVYDVEHTIHKILFKTILLLKRINTNIDLQSRIGSLLLYFPEMPDIAITEKLFE
jgi:5-methylcytosine-specific restriction enzyme subunit McrC